VSGEEKVIDMQAERQETALVHTEQGKLVRAASTQDVIAAFGEYQRIQAALDKMMPDSIMEIRDKKFRKKNYWRAIATAFNLNVEVATERRVEFGDDWGYEVSYRAIAPNGRVASGDGTCMASEKVSEEKGIFATVHNVRSHAHTRAYNRAVSNLVGFGEVSAEEVETGASRGPSGGRKATDKQTKMLWAKAKAKSEDAGVSAEDILKQAYETVGAKSKQDVLGSQVDALVKFIEGYDPAPAAKEDPVPF
jgi:hypothetical protein